MTDPRLNQLVSVVKTVNPSLGLVADLATTILGANRPRGLSKDLRRTITWIEQRTVELLEQIAAEAAKPDPSDLMIRELEVRLHETLDLLIDMKQETPWDGGTK